MENQIDEKIENNQVISDSDELKRLENLIMESEADLKELDEEIESLEKKINNTQKELESVEAKKNEPETPKILTRKQLKELNERYERVKEEKLQELKNNIDIHTKSEFERARLLRAGLGECSDSERKDAESRALQIEIDALEKEISVKKSIFYEKQEKLSDILADKISEDLKAEKLKKELVRLQREKQDQGIVGSDMRSRINMAVSQKNRLMHDYDKLSKEIDSINLKLKKSEKLLKVKTDELGNI